MSTLVESLKRLYAKGSIADEKLAQMVAEGKITEAELAYIKGGA